MRMLALVVVCVVGFCLPWVVVATQMQGVHDDAAAARTANSSSEPRKAVVDARAIEQERADPPSVQK